MLDISINEARVITDALAMRYIKQASKARKCRELCRKLKATQQRIQRIGIDGFGELTASELVYLLSVHEPKIFCELSDIAFKNVIKHEGTLCD